MLVCQCNVISQKEMEQAIIGLLDEDPWQIIVPAKVFRALHRQGKCGGCLPNLVDTIIRVVEAYHRQLETPDDHVSGLSERMADIRTKLEKKRDARRKQGYRTPESGPVPRARSGQPVLGPLPAPGGLGLRKTGR